MDGIVFNGFIALNLNMNDEHSVNAYCAGATLATWCGGGAVVDGMLGLLVLNISKYIAFELIKAPNHRKANFEKCFAHFFYILFQRLDFGFPTKGDVKA